MIRMRLRSLGSPGCPHHRHGPHLTQRAASRISCGSTLIAMMQTADLGEGNNIARRGKLYGTRPRAVLVEREMRSGVVVILKIVRQYAAQMTLVEDDNVIQAFTADRTDQTLDIRVLPG